MAISAMVITAHAMTDSGSQQVQSAGTQQRGEGGSRGHLNSNLDRPMLSEKHTCAAVNASRICFIQVDLLFK